MEATRVPGNVSMDKDVSERYIFFFSHDEYLFSHKKKKKRKERNPAICDSMDDLEGITLNEIS